MSRRQTVVERRLENLNFCRAIWAQAKPPDELLALSLTCCRLMTSSGGAGPGFCVSLHDVRSVGDWALDRVSRDWTPGVLLTRIRSRVMNWRPAHHTGFGARGFTCALAVARLSLDGVLDAQVGGHREIDSYRSLRKTLP